MLLEMYVTGDRGRTLLPSPVRRPNAQLRRRIPTHQPPVQVEVRCPPPQDEHRGVRFWRTALPGRPSASEPLVAAFAPLRRNPVFRPVLRLDVLLHKDMTNHLTGGPPVPLLPRVL